jgi:hypothetical protein
LYSVVGIIEESDRSAAAAAAAAVAVALVERYWNVPFCQEVQLLLLLLPVVLVSRRNNVLVDLVQEERVRVVVLVVVADCCRQTIGVVAQRPNGVRILDMVIVETKTMDYSMIETTLTQYTRILYNTDCLIGHCEQTVSKQKSRRHNKKRTEKTSSF